jgi:hypothetical protein
MTMTPAPHSRRPADPSLTIEEVRDHNLRIVRCHGVVSNELLREWALSLSVDDIRSTGNVLVDLRDATLDVTADGVWTFADMVHQRGLTGRRKLAIVGASDVAFAYGRMYQQVLERGEAEVRVFREYAEADRWVGE